MDDFTEEHINSLMIEEWLVKVDGQKSVPYLFKFHHSTMDLSCVILVTDTKSVWTEVLDTQKFARRWRACNPNSPRPYNDRSDEDSWRESNLELLSNVHTLGGIADISFEVIESNFSDFAFELELEHLKWRWETNFAGHRRSSEIISKQLILPLICANHISSTSPDSLSGMPDAEVEKAVDKVSRTARRALDNHVKIALTKPRTATMLRRITAMFNFVVNLPPIFSTAEKPDLEPKVMEQPPMPPRMTMAPITSIRPKASAQNMPPATSPDPISNPIASVTRPESSSGNSKGKAPAIQAAEGSETEDDSGEDDQIQGGSIIPSPEKSVVSPEREKRDATMRSPSPVPPSASTANLAKVASPLIPLGSESDAGSRPKPASVAKKPRLAASSSDDDSDAKPSQTTGVRRGARQPVKRGGKRF